MKKVYILATGGTISAAGCEGRQRGITMENLS